MFLIEIELHAQNLVIIPSSIVNISRVIYMIIQEDNSHFVDIWAPKIMRMATALIRIC